MPEKLPTYGKIPIWKGPNALKKLTFLFVITGAMLCCISFQSAAVYGLSLQPAAPELHGGNESTIRDPRPMTLAQLHSRYRKDFIFNGPKSKKQVALTFDDAPDPRFTAQILDALKANHAKATFFVVGNRAEANPELVRRMYREGHAVGNHTYNHPNLLKVKDAAFRSQVQRTDLILRGLIGYTPMLFRPPYGNINESQLKWMLGQKHRIINWDIDSLDWQGLSAEQVSANIINHAHPGAIILQHAGGGTGEDLSGTIKALPDIIRKLRAKGLEPVTVPQLLDMPSAAIPD
jgi:peptidoglycan/xylan/chitin deacetylase (PgdA/CDA1 family)